MFGQEMVKLTVLDLIVLFISSIIGDLFRFDFKRNVNANVNVRAKLCRISGHCLSGLWTTAGSGTWRGVFPDIHNLMWQRTSSTLSTTKVKIKQLAKIYLFPVILGMIWMGLFMAPGLPLLNLVKLIAIFYIKSWAVLVTNVPHETVFKVIPIITSKRNFKWSKKNNVNMLMLFSVENIY